MAAGQDTSRHGRDGRAVDAVFFDLFGTLLDLGGLVDDCETVAPGRGCELAARWRMRQLEFSWLRTAMGMFVDFDRVTADALEASMAELGLDIVDAFVLPPVEPLEDVRLHPVTEVVLIREH